MRLKVVNNKPVNQVNDDPFLGKGFSFSETEPKDTITDNGTAQNAKGGTELMRSKLYEYVDNNLLDQFQIICSRVRYVDTQKPTILWCHDTWDDPESQKLSDPEYRKQFAKFIFVSHEQMRNYQLAHGIPYDECLVIKNAIDPIEDIDKSGDTIKLIYHTTPHRGLEILYPVFNHLQPVLKDEGIDVTLDVYSSFEMYGWKERDKPFEKLFEALEEHEAINYHGFQENDVIRDALKTAHIYAYPCIWPETSCISLMEALSAGLVCVCPDFAALPETGANFPITYPWVSDPNRHANMFSSILYNIIKSTKEGVFDESRNMQMAYANSFYSWSLRAREWEATLRNILNEINQ